MAVAENNNAPRDWKKRESFASAMVQILIVALLLSGAVYFFYQRATTKKEIADRMKEAKALAMRDNPRDLAKAFLELEEIFKLDPNAKEALALAADIETQRWLVHRLEGSEQKARDYLERAEKQESRTEERFAAQILILIHEGKAEEAERMSEDLRKQGASSPKLWHALGETLQARGNLPLARTSFAKAVDMSWRSPRLFASYGEAMLDQADYRAAVDALQKGLNTNQDHTRSQLSLALARIYSEDRVKEAADTINAALLQDDLTPGLKARALAAQAELANFEKRYDDAVKTADQALQVNPKERFALFARARALAMKKDPGAADAFKAAVAQNRTSPVLYFTGARLLQAAGNFDAAVALLDDYAKFFGTVQVPDGEKTRSVLERDDRYWIIRGDLFRAGNKPDLALAAYDQAVAVDGVNRRQAHYARGVMFLDRKELDKAAEDLDKVTPEDGTGTLPEAYEAKGRLLFAKSDYALGCQNYAFALTGMKRRGVPRERLNDVVEDVARQLNASKQKEMAKIWTTEAKALIQ
jgi:tetratricopeptide (TPR) repeat protein